MTTETTGTPFKLPSTRDDAAKAILATANKAARADIYDVLCEDEGLQGLLIDALSFSYGLKPDTDFTDKQKMLEAAAEQVLDMTARVLETQRR